MGVIGKAAALAVAVVAVGTIAREVSKDRDPSGPAVSAENRCEERIASHLPQGAFIVSHTPDRDGRTVWIFDHGGMREAVACTVRPDGTIFLAAAGHD